MLHIRLPAAAIAAAALVLGFGGPSPAPAGEPSGLELAQSASFTDDQLQSFAMAALEVREIRASYVEQMQTAESEEQRQQLAEEANAEMVEAVRETPGITIEDYNAIIEASADDPQLSQRIDEHMQQAGQ